MREFGPDLAGLYYTYPPLFENNPVGRTLRNVATQLRTGVKMSHLVHKTLLIVFLAILATGCKISLMVSSGGDVTSLSGTNDCAQGPASVNMKSTT